MPSRPTISLIDGISVSQGSKQWSRPDRRGRALIAFLALATNGSASRERLAGLFWGETNEKLARGSLRQVLLEVQVAPRQIGADRLLANKLEITLPIAEFDVDILALTETLERG